MGYPVIRNMVHIKPRAVVDNIYFYKGAAPQPAVYPDPATAPTLDANVVDAVYSDVYGKGIKDHNPAWGGGPNPLWTKVEEVSVSETKKYIHVLGTGYGDRPAEALTADYNRAFVALYPTSATAGKLYSDNAYAKAIDFELTAGQWNYISRPLLLRTGCRHRGSRHQRRYRCCRLRSGCGHG